MRHTRRFWLVVPLLIVVGAMFFAFDIGRATLAHASASATDPRWFSDNGTGNAYTGVTITSTDQCTWLVWKFDSANPSWSINTTSSGDNALAGNAAQYFDYYTNGAYYPGLARRAKSNPQMISDASFGANTQPPQAGDLLIFQELANPSNWTQGLLNGVTDPNGGTINGSYYPQGLSNSDGHVTIVTGVHDGNVYFAEQNAGSTHDFGSASISWGSSGWHVSVPGFLGLTNRVVRGWIHYPANIGATSRAPVVATNYSGTLEAFQVGTDGQLYHRWQTALNGGWAANWVSLGGNWPNSTPVVAMDGTSHLEVFLRGTDDHIYVNTQVSGWSGWTAIGSGFTAIGDPTVARNVDLRLEVFAVSTGSGHAMWHNWQSASGAGNWQQGWSSLGGSWPIGHAAATMDYANTLEVFMRGTTNQIYVDTQASGWSGWNAIGTSFSARSNPSVAINVDGRLEVFVVGTNGTLWHNWQTNAGTGSWQASWGNLGSYRGGPWPTLNPASATDYNGNINVVMRGTTKEIYVDAQGNGWSGWSAIDPTFTALGDPAIATNADGRLEVFAIGGGTDDSLWHDWQTTPGTGSWLTSWGDLGGNWPN